MAESKFLKWQDKNNDKLNDDCPDADIVAEQQRCPSCMPNPNAGVPDWKLKTILEPFKNQRTCEYNITAVTGWKTTVPVNVLEDASPDGWTGNKEYSSRRRAYMLAEKNEESKIGTQPEERGTTVETSIAAQNTADMSLTPVQYALRVRFNQYADETIDNLLYILKRKNTPETRQQVKDAIIYKDYDLSVRRSSTLKLLYAVPVDVIEAIETDEAREIEEPPERGDVKRTYRAGEIKLVNIKVRKGLDLYNRYLKVFRTLEHGNILFKGTGAVFNLENYGDPGYFGGGLLAEAMLQFDDYLNTQGYNLAGIGGMFPLFSGNEKVEKIRIIWDKNYKVKKLKIWTEECPRWPKILGKSRLRSLRKKSAWRDPTAMAYFANMRDMDNDLSARTPMPWVKFIKKHTYPEVFDTIADWKENQSLQKRTAGSCISSALEAETKELAQDILDEVFSIGDSIAYMWHKSICSGDTDDTLKDLKKSGIRYDPDKEGGKTTMKAMATEQAFKKMQQENVPFLTLCQSLLGIDFLAPPSGILDALWEHGFDKIKLCGLFDIMSDAIKCLLGGLTLEQALGVMLKNALGAMGVENYGKLFAGLPPEKQAELDALVKKKIESGDILPDYSGAQALSDRVENDTGTLDTPLLGKTKWVKPWENEDHIEAQREGTYQGDYGATMPGINELPEPGSERNERTLAQQFDKIGDSKDQIPPDTILSIYITAMLELYSDDLLGLVDKLNGFPGAPVVAFMLSAVDCPSPPLFNPGVMDFIKDLTLPFCRNVHEITLPMLFNPFGWITNWADPFKILWEILKQVIEQVVLQILIMLLVKLCEIIGNSICRALGTVGSLAAALPSVLAGTANFSDVLKDSICGPEADQEQIGITMQELYNTLGSGGAALADKETVVSFAEELSASTTRRELLEAFSGQPNRSFLSAVDNILEMDFPELREGLKNKTSIGSFFSNIGNLFPVEFRDQMDQLLNDLPEDDELPANPSLCASQEDLDTFKELRCSLLDGRATKEQCGELFDKFQNKALEDLDDITRIMQQGLPQYIQSQMPPLVSEPGCDDGIMPYEPQEILDLARRNTKGDYERLKIAFVSDMLGRKGFIDMIMSDTMGNPLSNHYARSHNQDSYVDFYIDLTGNNSDDDPEDMVGGFTSIKHQKGAFPTRVAGWLQDKMLEIGAGTDALFTSNNEFKKEYVYTKTFDDMGFSSGLFGLGDAVDLIDIDTPQYNVYLRANFEDELIIFKHRGRKATPDMRLEFRDNNKGNATHSRFTSTEFKYGFDLSLYLSDSVKGNDEYNEETQSRDFRHNRPDDNARIIIKNVFNPSSLQFSPSLELMSEEKKEKYYENMLGNNGRPIKSIAYEFIAADNGLSYVDPSKYPNFQESFFGPKAHLPQVILLSEMLGLSSPAIIKGTYDSIVSKLTNSVMLTVANNDVGFNYGAEFDNISGADMEYVVPPSTTESPGGTPYWEAEVRHYDEDGSFEVEQIHEADRILGISKMQYRIDHQGGGGTNRVFYLDPKNFGGSYANPPVYISPSPNKGWLGFIDVLFPEGSPCKPTNTDLIAFDDIASKVSDSYPTIPEDERLKNIQDCVVEKPYHRILTRDGKAAIEGLIYAGIRMYSTVHLTKAMATFTKFKPDFINLQSSIFASYILEKMEDSYKDAQGDFSEWFNPFKDIEFWYAWLEQCVQLYGRRCDNDDIPNGHAEPPVSVQRALDRINDLQERYRYPFEDDLDIAAGTGEAGTFQSLRGYREEKNLEFIQRTEEDAKIIAKEFVIEQLQIVGEQLVNNMKVIGLSPSVTDVDYYFMETMCAGTTDLSLDKVIKQQIVDLPSSGTDHYTAGGEFSYASGQNYGREYIGDFHVIIDEGTQEEKYMEGPRHIDDEHASLRPLAHKMQVPIGDIAEYGTITPSAISAEHFLLEKYVSINGTKYSPTRARQLIRSKGPSNLSDIYPGTLKIVKDDKGRDVGLTGELGVRYGVALSIIYNSKKHLIAEGSTDALDLPCTAFGALEANSMLLYCVIRKLKENNEFKTLSRYILPINKIISTVAIYNDMGFIPSIGENTVAPGDLRSKTWDQKPGRRAQVEINSDGSVNVEVGGTHGWAHAGDRNPGFFSGMFVTEWDNWDRVLLRKSKSMMKRLFKTYYNTRSFDLAAADDAPSTAKTFLRGLRESLRPSPGQKLLPSWQKGMIRSNPFDANGKMCKPGKK